MKRTGSAWRVWLAGIAAVLCACTAWAQLSENPVYLDDSPSAIATLGSIDELLDQGNEGEAARVLQRLLDEQGQRVIASADDPDLFVSVRSRVHAALLARGGLLERYRVGEQPRAAALLAGGAYDRAETTRLLTRAGFEAALRIAQLRMESAQFDAAWRMIAQLDTHPDRTGDGARDAARLAGRIAAYVDRDACWSLAGRWASEGGLDAPTRRLIEPPPSSEPERHSALRGSAATVLPSLAELVPEPLGSSPLTPGIEGLSSMGEAQRGLPPAAWAMPEIVGDTLYLSDGQTVSALDRFTLRPLWRVQTTDPSGQQPDREWTVTMRRRISRVIEDGSCITIAGDTLLCPMGRATGAIREGDRRVHALDRRTGRTRWAVDVAALDPALEGLSPRGPVVVVGDVAIVTGEKNVRARRLSSLYLVGLDLRTGAVLWWRPIASAGTLPFRRTNASIDGSGVDRGVVYTSDEIGVIGAAEGLSGRPLWVRRVRGTPSRSNERVTPWNISLPIFDRDTVVLLSPDRSKVLRLDAATGRVLAARGASQLGMPRYIMRVGEWLACVSDRRIAFVPLASFETADVSATLRYDAPGLRGRIAVAGGRVFVPLVGGVDVVDPGDPGDSRRIALDRVGTLLALPGQIIAVDESRAYSFLSWASATELLEQRMQADTSDPAPATIYAELAFRVGRHGLILPAVDRALAVIERDLQAHGDAGDRLFESLLPMVGAERAGEAFVLSMGGAAEVVSEQPPEMVADRALREQLTERAGRLTRTPDQVVSHRLLLGRLAAEQGRNAEAIGAWQQVLDDPALGSANWHSGGATVRGDREAARRIVDLVRAQGLGVYESQQAAARLAVEELADEAPPQGAAALAVRYPIASVTPGLWLRVASDSGAGRLDAMRALRRGIESAETIQAAGGEPDRAVVGRLVGRLIRQLAQGGRTDRAAALLARSRERFGDDLPIMIAGAPAGDDPLLASLGAGDSRGVRLPRIGTHLSDEPAVHVFSGQMLEPMFRMPGSPTDAALLVSPDVGLRLIARDEQGRLGRRWTIRATGDAEPVVLRWGAGSAELFWSRRRGGGGGVVESIDLSTGARRWISEPFDEAVAVLDAPPEDGVGARFALPGGSPARSHDLVIAADAGACAIVERSGRAMVVDLTTGATLWSKQLGVEQVIDAVLGDGLLVACGIAADPGGVGGGAAIEAVDAGSGQRIRRLDHLGSRARWLRLHDDGLLLCGLGSAVLGVNMLDGGVQWAAGGRAGGGTRDAWVFGDRLVVIDDDGSPWMLDIDSGRAQPDPLDDRGVLSGRDGLRTRAQPERLTVSGSLGTVIFDRSGRVVGADAIDADTALLGGAFGEGVIATIAPEPEWRGAGLWIHLIDDTSCRLLDTRFVQTPGSLRLIPQRIGIIDGTVLIGFGTVTLAIEAPAE